MGRLRKYWSKIVLAMVELVAGVRQLVRPRVIVRTVSSNTSKRGMTAEEEVKFDSMMKKIDEIVDEFKGFFLSLTTRLNYSFSLRGERELVEQHLLCCPWCGRRNRLQRGIEGAVCGSCRKPLSPTTIHTN